MDSAVQHTDSWHTEKSVSEKMAVPMPMTKRPLFNKLDDGLPPWFEVSAANFNAKLDAVLVKLSGKIQVNKQTNSKF